MKTLLVIFSLALFGAALLTAQTRRDYPGNIPQSPPVFELQQRVIIGMFHNRNTSAQSIRIDTDREQQYSDR